eukprot:176120-Rhodomonas_salina.1
MLGCMVQEIPCVHCLKANTECRECAYSHGNDAWRRVMRVMKAVISQPPVPVQCQSVAHRMERAGRRIGRVKLQESIFARHFER